MIDTIHAYAKLSFLGSTKVQLIKLLKPFSFDPEPGKKGTLIRTKPDIGLTFVVNNETIDLKQSLCKFYFGDNIRTLTFWDTKQAIAMLDSELSKLNIGLGLSDFTITRIDVADNLVMDHPVSLYLDACVGPFRYRETRYYVRRELTGKSFEQALQGLYLYDKGKEIEYHQNHYGNGKKKLIADSASDMEASLSPNTLRVEFRAKKNVANCLGLRKLGFTRLTLADLLKASVYDALVRTWYKHVINLEFNLQPIIDFSSIRTSEDAKRSGHQLLVYHAGGPTPIDRAFKQNVKDKKMSKKVRTGLVKRLRESVEDPTLMIQEGANLKAEFRDKVCQAALRNIRHRQNSRVTLEA